MSFDKQNFARTVQEQQAGIAPQMWPILLNPGALDLNSPFEVDINPCDTIWLPVTYDKSYGVNPAQTDPTCASFFIHTYVAGMNVTDEYSDTQKTYVQAPVIGLRFNTPNNPWTLWSLGSLQKWNAWGAGPAYAPTGVSTAMRSISAPLSRLWCQYYAWAMLGGTGGNNPMAPANQQIVLMSMLGFSQQSVTFHNPNIYSLATATTGPPLAWSALSSGGYRTTDLNSSDLRVLGQSPYPVAPTTSGPGSTKG